MDRKKLAIVVPCFNEEETLKSNITKLITTLEDLIQKSLITQDSFICFIDDGSNDKTWELIENSHNENPQKVKGIKFTKNFGNQNAIISGLQYVHKQNVDCAITIDADLQQDINKIEELMTAAEEDFSSFAKFDESVENISIYKIQSVFTISKRSLIDSSVISYGTNYCSFLKPFLYKNSSALIWS